MSKQTFKTSTGTRTVFTKDKPNFRQNQSTVFAVPNVNNAISQANPMRTQMIGVHPNQVKEFNERYQEEGIVGAFHEPDGTLVLESKQARNAVLKTRGARDNDACYGDWGGEHN